MIWRDTWVHGVMKYAITVCFYFWSDTSCHYPKILTIKPQTLKTVLLRWIECLQAALKSEPTHKAPRSVEVNIWICIIRNMISAMSGLYRGYLSARQVKMRMRFGDEVNDACALVWFRIVGLALIVRAMRQTRVGARVRFVDPGVRFPTSHVQSRCTRVTAGNLCWHLAEQQ